MTKKIWLPKDKKSRTIAILLAGLLSVGFAQAQESANCSGGNATGSGGTVSYSVGQVAHTAYTGITGSLAQGVQHPYEIYSLDIKETNLNLSLAVFPNPTTENLILKISDFNNRNLSYQLMDMQGKQLSIGKIMAPQTQINTASLPAANYLINVLNQENKKLQSLKIIKN